MLKENNIEYIINSQILNCIFELILNNEHLLIKKLGLISLKNIILHLNENKKLDNNLYKKIDVLINIFKNYKKYNSFISNDLCLFILSTISTNSMYVTVCICLSNLSQNIYCKKNLTS